MATRCFRIGWGRRLKVISGTSSPADVISPTFSPMLSSGSWAETWRRIWGGTKKFFRGPISGKISIFRVQISDDLFFSHRLGSSDFPFLFSYFPYVYYVKMSYMNISSQENHNFSLCAYFHAHPTTLLLKILGGDQCMGCPPHLKFWGDRPPPVPPRSPPLHTYMHTYIHTYIPTYIHTCKYTHMYTYIGLHTDIHTYI